MCMYVCMYVYIYIPAYLNIYKYIYISIYIYKASFIEDKDCMINFKIEFVIFNDIIFYA